MNKKWYAVFLPFKVIRHIIFCESSRTYYGVLINDRFIKFTNYEPFTLDMLNNSTAYLGYIIQKEYETFAEVIVDYPEIIDL